MRRQTTAGSRGVLAQIRQHAHGTTCSGHSLVRGKRLAEQHRLSQRIENTQSPQAARREPSQQRKAEHHGSESGGQHSGRFDGLDFVQQSVGGRIGWQAPVADAMIDVAIIAVAFDAAVDLFLGAVAVYAFMRWRRRKSRISNDRSAPAASGRAGKAARA